MEEKILIKSENFNTKAFMQIMLCIGIALMFLMILLTRVFTIGSIVVCAGWGLIGYLVHIIFSKIELTVTDKRIYGTALFGKRVDLPLDSISAVSTAWIKTITVTTSSGRISFSLIKNSDKLHSEISKLLIERQNKTNETIIKQEIPQSNADELKKYKELLDSDVITQEEFDQKKKQLLGL